MRAGAVVLMTAGVVVAGVAQAAIVPQVSIGGAKVGMTKAQLKAALGTPKSTHTGGGSTEIAYRTVTAVLVNGKVAGLTTKAASEKVAGGIGVGSTEAALKQKVKGVKCVVNFGTRVCNLLPPGYKVGKAYTAFFVDAGKVSRISISTSAPLKQS